MKRILFIIALIFTFLQLSANSLDCYFTVKRYFEPTTEQNYVELAYLIPGNIVSYIEVSKDQFQAQLLVQVDLLDAKNEIVFHHTYLLKSPFYTENTQALSNMSDLINLPYSQDSLSLLFQILDLNDSTKYFTDKLEISLLNSKENFLSDISLLASKNLGQEGDLFFKNGHILVPKFINYYPSEIGNLSFYLEAYTGNLDENYLLKYFISDENNVIIEKYSNFKKLKASNTEALLSEFDISTLPSGNFYVYAELRDSQNKLLDRKRMYFQRYNKISSEVSDKIDYYELAAVNNNFAKKYNEVNIVHHLKALKPIATEFEESGINGALNSGKLEIMHSFFFSFWLSRDTKHAEDAWMEYAEKLQYVDKQFGNSMIEGHETERGEIYLKYGKPTENITRNTPQYGRIEIWNYDEINGQGDIVFLFTENPQSNDEFKFVHSNLNNEIYSKDWAQILKNNNF